MEVTIEKLDHKGQGIAHIDNITTFIPKAIPKDIVEIEITKKKKHYQIGRVTKYIKRSNDYKPAFCPFYDLCGGCDLQNFSYEKQLEYKKEKVKNIFGRMKIEIDPIVVANKNPKNYRNKIELKVKEGKIGFYQAKTNKIVEINNCMITRSCINKVLPFIKTWNILEGNITIRCNQNEEVLIIIETKDAISMDIEKIKDKIKLVGVVLNKKPIYGESFIIERINGVLFKYSYDAFFQVNPEVAKELFAIVKENMKENLKVLDLYSGVGTFSLTLAKKSQKVVGVEIVPNAVLNAINNAKINRIENVEFLLNDVEDAISKIKEDFDVWVIDPPRSGIDKNTIQVIKKNIPPKIIYISCDPQTLARDVNDLKEDYIIEKTYVLDMFSYTYHVETICIMNSR